MAPALSNVPCCNAAFVFATIQSLARGHSARLSAYPAVLQIATLASAPAKSQEHNNIKNINLLCHAWRLAGILLSRCAEVDPTMFRDILIIFDGQKICQEALTYAKELSNRMDARVSFLMLINMSFLGRFFLDAKRRALNSIEDHAARLLSDATEAFVQQGIEVRSAFRIGEPAQELLKFLAVHAPFQAVIWGSTPELPGRGHWIGRASASMECPLLCVSKKGGG